MLSDYERRVVAEFETEFRSDLAVPDHSSAAHQPSLVALLGTLTIADVTLALALPLPAAAAAMMGAAAGPLAGLTFVESMFVVFRPRRTRAEPDVSGAE